MRPWEDLGGRDVRGAPERRAAESPKLQQTQNKALISSHLITNSSLTLEKFKPFHIHYRLIKLCTQEEEQWNVKKRLKDYNASKPVH